MTTTPLSTSPVTQRDPSRLIVGILALAGLAVLPTLLPDRDALGRSLPVSFGFGALFGVVLQRSRFCFWCIFRDWFAERDPRGMLGILAALATGAIGYTAVFGMWLPDPSGGRLPPDAHVGPVSLTLAGGAFLFGLGMALSGSCVSAHLYRLGEGAFGSLIALAGAFCGFILGFLAWNSLYLVELYRARVIWLPQSLGYGGALALTLGVLAGLALVFGRGRWPDQDAPRGLAGRVLGQRWPAVLGGILVGWIAVLAYLRVGPLGVTAELGSLSRTAAEKAGWLPEVLHGLDGFAGCATAVKEAVLSRNGVFVLGMILASALSATLAGDWKPALPQARALPRLFGGGLLLGFGAMVSLGCTIGVLLSGIMAGAGSGWVFGGFCLLGAWAGWRLRGRA